MSQFINYHSLSGKAGIDRTDEAKPSSEHRCLVLAQPQANGDETNRVLAVVERNIRIVMDMERKAGSR